MKYLSFLLLFISFTVLSQKTNTRKIIIINNEDTTVIATDPESVDSLIEVNMKVLYGIDSVITEEKRIIQNESGNIQEETRNIQIEVFVDSIMEDIEESIVIMDDPADTLKLKMGNKRIVVIEKENAGEKNKRKIIIDEDVTFKNEDEEEILEPIEDTKRAHWAGFGMGLNPLMNANGKFATESDAPFLVLDYGKSLNFQFNVWDRRFPIYKDYIGLSTGLGFQWNRYGLQKNVDVMANADSIYAINNTTVNYSKNVLRSTYLQVPLLLDFDTHADRDKSWHLSIGVIGGVRVGSSLKTKWENSGKPQRSKTTDDFNFSSLSANAYAQLGYRNTNLFVQYGLTEVFRSGKGPELSPLTAGILFSF
jgi:hypothetical protein